MWRYVRGADGLIHVHDLHGGAWCCLDLHDALYGSVIPATNPITCFWCLAGLLGGI